MQGHYGQHILVAGHAETIEAAATLLLELVPGACTRIGFQTGHAWLTRSADRDAMSIIVTALPGQAGEDADVAGVHGRAGALHRLLHDCEQPRALPWYPRWLADRADYWTGRVKPLLSTRDLVIIEGHLRALDACEVPFGVPCHLDFQPRNWLVDQTGAVRLIDFEHARVDIPARDFVRLHFRVWVSRPDLRDAFFAGYGRHLKSGERELVWHLGALDVLTAFGRGRENGDASLLACGRATLGQLRDSS